MITPSTTTTGTHLPRPHQVVASLPSLVGPARSGSLPKGFSVSAHNPVLLGGGRVGASQSLRSVVHESNHERKDRRDVVEEGQVSDHV
jgi:hypothetical protein